MRSGGRIKSKASTRIAVVAILSRPSIRDASKTLAGALAAEPQQAPVVASLLTTTIVAKRLSSASP